MYNFYKGDVVSAHPRSSVHENVLCTYQYPLNKECVYAPWSLHVMSTMAAIFCKESVSEVLDTK